MNGKTGELVWNFDQDVRGDVLKPMWLADRNQDGIPELIVTFSNSKSNEENYGKPAKVLLINGKTGKSLFDLHPLNLADLLIVEFAPMVKKIFIFIILNFDF